MFNPVEKMNINQCMLKESRSPFKIKNEVKKHFKKKKKKRTKTKTEINDKWTLNFKGANRKLLLLWLPLGCFERVSSLILSQTPLVSLKIIETC